MLFNSLEFALFFALVATAYAVLARASRQNWLLLAASYLFYGWWDVRCLGLLVLSGWANHAVGARIAAAPSPRSRWRWLVLGVTLDLALLGYFKYAKFFLGSPFVLDDERIVQAVIVNQPPLFLKFRPDPVTKIVLHHFKQAWTDLRY